jgi:hypothetical protein
MFGRNKRYKIGGKPMQDVRLLFQGLTDKSKSVYRNEIELEDFTKYLMSMEQQILDSIEIAPVTFSDSLLFHIELTDDWISENSEFFESILSILTAIGSAKYTDLHTRSITKLAALRMFHGLRFDTIR